MNCKPLFGLACLTVLVVGPRPAVAQHTHIYAGAARQAQGETLWFVNGDLWDTNSYGGYAEAPACIYLEDNLPDGYPGLYQTATTFSALPATIFNAGPSPSAASIGSFIELRFVSLQGPAGGSLTVWNEIDDPTHPAPLFSLPVGLTNGTDRISLSEGDPADPTADPYGHIHGRRFTVDKPGLYTLALQLIDTSVNGPQGGPIHAPSPVTAFYFQAGLALSDFSVSNHVASARVGLVGGNNYVVETSGALPSTNWITLTNITAAPHSELRWIVDSGTTAPLKFYRVRQSPN